MNISLEFTEAFQRRFRDCFPRRETWERFLLCLHDRLHDPERISPDAALPEGTGAVRSRQRFLSDAVWDAEKVMARYHEEVRDVLGDRDGALVFQTVDFVKKGSDSAGVARQPCGPTGRPFFPLRAALGRSRSGFGLKKIPKESFYLLAYIMLLTILMEIKYLDNGVFVKK